MPYAVRYTSRDFSDGSDSGKFERHEIMYSDPSAAHEFAMKLESEGYFGITIYPIKNDLLGKELKEATD